MLRLVRRLSWERWAGLAGLSHGERRAVRGPVWWASQFGGRGPAAIVRALGTSEMGSIAQERPKGNDCP